MRLTIDRTAHSIAQRVQVVVAATIREMYPRPRSGGINHLVGCLDPNGRYPSQELFHHRIEAAVREVLAFAQQTGQSEEAQAQQEEAK